MKRIIWIVMAAVVLILGAVQTAAVVRTAPSTDPAAVAAASDTAELLSAASGADDTLTESDRIADREDGINLRATTALVIVISAVFLLAILAVVLYLAKKNRQP